MVKSAVSHPGREYRLLFITYEYDKFINGGVGRVINGLAAELSIKLDFDIFLLNAKDGHGNWTVKIFKIRNRKCRRKSVRSDYIKILIHLVKSERYDLVHFIHSGQKVTAMIKSIKEHCPAIKMIYSCHSISRFDRQLRNICSSNVQSEDYILKECDHIHLLNQTSFKLLKQTYPQVTEKTSVSLIPNGIAEMDFHKTLPYMRQKLERILHKHDNLIVVCMTRWSYGKGIEYFLDSIPAVVKADRRIKFIIAGKKKHSWENGYADYCSLIEEKLKAVKEHITVLGWLDDEKRNTLYALADIWVMPSLLEYFPYSILEPAICKIPIISSRIESVAELLEENKECLFFEPGNSVELACKIIYLSRNEKMREQLQNNAYNKINNHYQWYIIAGMYMNMYRTVHINNQCKQEYIEEHLISKN